MTNVQANEVIVKQLHEKKLQKWRSRPLARPESYLSRMLYAVKKIPVPIDSTPNPELKAVIERLRLPPPTRFEVVRAVNEILKYLGRAGLDNPRPLKDEEVSYVPLDTFLGRLGLIKHEQDRLYLASLYACGARFGELPRLRLMGDWAYIATQLRDDGRDWVTKNKKKRHAAILPPLKSFIMAYKALSQSAQDNLRLDHRDRIYKAARRVYGANIHTLRHSYAIECIKAGKGLSEVAKWIGDAEEVAKRYYIGYLAPSDDPWKK